MQLACGNHRCTRVCHAGACPPCERHPDNMKTCACGQQSLTGSTAPLELIVAAAARRSCLDAWPTCDGICRRPLSCGRPAHTCRLPCHDGPCESCTFPVTLACRCGAQTQQVSCVAAGAMGDEFLCDRICRRVRLCGRHQCGVRCCNSSNEDHVCPLICGKRLRCNQHSCTQLCHRGHCAPCNNVRFTELTCQCGSTVIEPPVACGTPPPTCALPCQRPHSCSHPVTHTCHSEATCPPCLAPVDRYCAGGHELRRHVPCHLREVQCGQRCGKLLLCGEHRCQRACHAGPCQSPEMPYGTPCDQRCGRRRAQCEHECAESCHSLRRCPARPCLAPVRITCACGVRAAVVPCLLGGPTAVLLMSTDMLAKAVSSFLAEQPDVAGVRDMPLVQLQQAASSRLLECDDACKHIARCREIANALGVRINNDGARINAASVPGHTVAYTEAVCELGRQCPELLGQLEAVFGDLCAGRCPSGVVQLPVMSRIRRKLVHSLCEYYGITATSFDAEPNRSVVVEATAGASVPVPLLSDVLKAWSTSTAGGAGASVASRPQSCVSQAEHASVASAGTASYVDGEAGVWPGGGLPPSALAATLWTAEDAAKWRDALESPTTSRSRSRSPASASH